jgi:hypothetical protein
MGVRTFASSSITNTVGDSVKGCQYLKLTPGIGCTASLTGVVRTRQLARPAGALELYDCLPGARDMHVGSAGSRQVDIAIQQVKPDSIPSAVYFGM